MTGASRSARRSPRSAASGPDSPADAATVWEPDHLDARHPLARKANAMCDAREHTMRRRIGKVACGQCWETVIRQDEQLAVRTLRAVPDTAAAGAQ